LLWLFHYKAAQQHQLFTSGVIRIDDPEGRIFNFINNCPGTYTRLSTHFAERLSETIALHGGQRGLDFKNMTTLPVKKAALLFFRLGDGTLILKLEHAGCPPFWKTDFMTIENTIEYGRHSRDYMKTRVIHNKGMPIRRTEKVPEDAINIFTEALWILFPPENFKVQGEYSVTNIHREQLQNYGITHGISAMIDILSGELSPSEVLFKESTGVGSFIISNNNMNLMENTHLGNNNNDSMENSHLKTNESEMMVSNSCIWVESEDRSQNFKMTESYLRKLMERVEPDRERGYKGERKGSEVCVAIDWDRDSLNENFSII